MKFHPLLFVVFSYSVIILIVFGIEPFISQNKLIFGDDLHLSYYFFRTYFTQSLLNGEFPWWNPYLFSGYPYVAHPQAVQLFYPVHWLFLIVPIPLMYSWYLAGHIVLAMTGMYWLASKFIRREGAFVTGVVFGLSGFFMARIFAGHVDMIAAAAYLPWVFGFYWVAMEKGTTRDIVFAGIALMVQLFVGYQTVALFTLESVGIAALVLTLSKKSVRVIYAFLLSTCIGVGLAAIQLIPQQEFVNRSIRSFPFPYEWASAQHLIKEQLKTLISPFYYGDQWVYKGPWPNLAEYAMYIGLVPLGLALASLLGLVKRGINRIPILIFFIVALFALWISFADKAPIDLMYLLWNYVPVYHSLRIPVRHLLLFVFGMSMLAGFALHFLRYKLLIGALFLAVLIDLVPFAKNFIELKDIPEERHDPKLVNFIKGDSTLFRTHPIFGVWLEPRSSLDFDSAMTYRYFSTTGYDPSILRNYYEFIDAAGGHMNPSFLEHNVQVPYVDLNSEYINYLNIKYIFMPNWLDPIMGLATPQYHKIFDDPERFYRLYENKSLYPRFYIVHTARAFQNRDEVYKAFVLKQAQTATEVLTEENVFQSTSHPCEDSFGKQVTVENYGGNEITLRVTTPCDGFLASSEVMYPGWVATVDGKPTQIFEGNLAFRTIPIPQGTHYVVFRYVPRIFIIGGGVSVLFILIIMILYKKNWRI